MQGSRASAVLSRSFPNRAACSRQLTSKGASAGLLQTRSAGPGAYCFRQSAPARANVVGSALAFLGLKHGLTEEGQKGQQFLEENGKNEGVVTLPSGLQYKVLSAGSGLESPLWSTPCSCHYEGRLLNGHKFDSSYDRGTPTTFAPNQVIPGWTEAMQLMVEGDEWEMYIPAELAYGKAGAGATIPPDATLVFKMKMMKIMGPGKKK
eukprot:g12346.t1